MKPSRPLLRRLSPLLLAAVPGLANASPVAARLTESVAKGISGCPPVAALRDAVAVHLGYDPFHEPATEVVSLQIDLRSTGLNAHLTLSDLTGGIQGERTLGASATDCQDLTEAIALAISIALDPLGKGAAATTVAPDAGVERQVIAAQAKDTGDRADAPHQDEHTPALPGSAAPSSAAPDVLLELAVVGLLGAAPTPTGGVVIGGEFRFQHASLALEGRADLPSSAQIGGGAISTALVVGQLVPCFRAGWFGACLVAQGGAETAQARNLPSATTGVGAYGALGARLLGDLPLGASGFSLRAALEALAPFTRSHVLVGSESVFTTPPLAGALSLGVTYRVL